MSTITFVVFVRITIFRDLLVQILPSKDVCLQYIRPYILFRVFSLVKWLVFGGS